MEKLDLNILRNAFEKDYMKVVYDMIRSKMFVPTGLELNNTAIYFNTNDTFPLKDVTFAYFNPINNSININIESPFFTNCTSAMKRINRLFFVLYHEIMHKMLMHSERINSRQPSLWNIACDYEIHNMLYIYNQAYKQDQQEMNILENYLEGCEGLVFNHSGEATIENPKFCFEKRYLQNIAEEIYTMIENSKVEKEQTFEFSLNDFMNNSDDSSTNSSNGSSDENDDESNDGDSGEDKNGSKTSGKSEKENDTKTVSNENSSSGNKNAGQVGNSKSNASDNNSTIGNIPVKATQTTYRLPDGSTYTVTNIDWPEEHQLPESMKNSEKTKERIKEANATNRSLMENQLIEICKQKGNGSADCSKFLKKLFHIKVDWVKILRNSLQTVLEKSDYFAWNKVRTSSFLLPNMPYLPDIVEDEEKYGTLIIARDESGSMSDSEIEKAGAIIMDAKAFYKKIVLIKHDTKISKVYEFEEMSDEVLKILLTRDSCGGTSHKEVFEYLRDYRKTHAGETVSCFIGISDMESDIEEYQNLIPSEIPVIYLAPVNFDRSYDSVKGKVIPVEL